MDQLCGAMCDNPHMATNLAISQELLERAVEISGAKTKTAAVTMALEAEGFEVRTYSDGAAALAALSQTPPDLAVLDIKMPRMDGMELLRRIRQKSDLPVIFLTSKDEEIDEVLGLRMGADDYMRKPFSQRLLIERIRAVLRRREAIDMLVAVACIGALGAALLASSRAVVSAQYVFCLLPWIALLASAPLAPAATHGTNDEPAEERTSLAWAYAAALVIPSVAGLGLYFTKYGGDRPRWRDAYRYVWNEREPGDLVLGANSPVGEYYLNPGYTDLRTPEREAVEA